MSAPCPILGFTVLIDLRETADESQAGALTQALTELLAAQGLVSSGGGRRQLLFVVGREGSQATEAERQLVERWAAEWSHVAAITVSDLVDLSPAS
ncbi:MAG: 50S ribosome-binding protein YggL [Gemmatimonadaceae bacterium]